MKVPQVCVNVNRADGITIQNYALEQNHVLCDDLASISLGWRRGKIDLGQVPAVYRKDFASGVVNAGMDDVLFGLQGTQDLPCRSRIVEGKRGGAVRSDHFRGSNQIIRLRKEESGPVADGECCGGYEQGHATGDYNNPLKLMTDG